MKKNYIVLLTYERDSETIEASLLLSLLDGHLYADEIWMDECMRRPAYSQGEC